MATTFRCAVLGVLVFCAIIIQVSTQHVRDSHVSITMRVNAVNHKCGRKSVMNPRRDCTGRDRVGVNVNVQG